MEMYNNWFENNIQRKLKNIGEPIARINFLFEEKNSFISMHTGKDADQVLKKFDNLIDREKTMLELNKNIGNGEKNLDDSKVDNPAQTLPPIPMKGCQ